MTRETRHLRISNLPNGLADSKLLEHFSSYGPVQKVDRPDPASGSAVVSFIDIRTAAKAMSSDHKVEGSNLRASYYEPGSSSGSSSAVIEIFESSEALNSASPRSNSTGNSRAPPSGTNANSKDSPSERAAHSSNSHAQERIHRHHSSDKTRDHHHHKSEEGGGAGKSYIFRGLRSRTSARGRGFPHGALHYRGSVIRGRYPTRPWRGRGLGPDLQRRQSGFKDNFSGISQGPRRSYSNTSSGGAPYPRQSGPGLRQNSWDVRAEPSRIRGSRQNGGFERRRRRSSSGSSRASKSPSHRSSRSSVSPSPSVSSRGSRNAAKIVGGSNSSNRLPKSAPVNSTTAFDRSDFRRADTESPVNGEIVDPSSRVGLIIKNLPIRSRDSSIKDGLFFMYKRLGRVSSVKVIGEGDARYGIVIFKKGLEVAKTIEQTDNEMFFGSPIRVALCPPELLDAKDNEQKPLEKFLDEHHPRSSRTLYVGNLDPRVSENSLKDRFGQFGFIVDVDIKNRDTPAPYAFVQYADITSVIKAIQETEHENEMLSENKRAKVGFGKTLATNIVWLDEVPEQVDETYLLRKMKMYGEVTDVLIDSFLHQALITFQNESAANEAAKALKGRMRTIGNIYVQVDFGSDQLNDLFIDRMYRSKQLMAKKQKEVGTPRLPLPHSPLDHHFPGNGENGPGDSGFPRKLSKSGERRPYTREGDFPVPFESGTANGGSGHMSRHRDGLGRRSRESSRLSDTDMNRDGSRHRPPSPPTDTRKNGPKNLSIPVRSSSASRSLSSSRKPQLSSRVVIKSSRKPTKSDGGRRKLVRSPSSRSSSGDSSSDSEDSSSSDGSSSESESSTEPSKRQKTTKAPKETKAIAEKGGKTINALENKKSAILQMLETLDDKKTPANPAGNICPMAIQPTGLVIRPPMANGADGLKAKLGEVFDLGWQQGVVPTGVPPPNLSAPGDSNPMVAQGSTISGPFEDEDLLNQAVVSEKDEEVSVGFKKRRPKAFHPRQNLADENLGDNSPVEVNPHPKAAQIDVELQRSSGGESKLPTTPLTAPPAVTKNRDSGFFDSEDIASKTSGHGHHKLQDKKQSSLDLGPKKGGHHSPVAGHGRPHHSGTHAIPLEQKPNFVGTDPRSAVKCATVASPELPLPNFSVDCVFVTIRNTRKRSGDLSGNEMSDGEKKKVGRTVSGGSSSEDMAMATTSPEGSLPTPTRSGDELFCTGKSPISAFNTSSSSPSRPSLEERIRALDAKFSALEQNMQAAKDKPAPASSAGNSRVDLSKYKVKHKPVEPVKKELNPSYDSKTSEFGTKSLYKSSIFDQDIERLKGLDEKYTPSTAALLSRSADVKSEPLEDILEILQAKDSISFGTTKVKPEKSSTPKKATGSTKQHLAQQRTGDRSLKTPLSINIPTAASGNHAPPGAVDTSKSHAPITSHSAGISPSMLISPPPQRGILKKPKTPTSATPGSSSGPIFPPNLSIPPPPLPQPFGVAPGIPVVTPITPSSSGPITPTDPRMAAKKDPGIRSPSSETPPSAATTPSGTGGRSTTSFGGFQKNQAPWPAGQNRSAPPPHTRQASYPSVEVKSVPQASAGLPGTGPSTPKSGYNVDPRKQSIFASAPKREEKQFGLKHDRPAEANQPSIFQIMGVNQGRKGTHQSTVHKPNKELRNKELEELFRKQGQENKVTEKRKELTKIKKRDHRESTSKSGSESKEKSVGEKKKDEPSKDAAKSGERPREKDLLNLSQIRKERKEKERKEREEKEKNERQKSEEKSANKHEEKVEKVEKCANKQKISGEKKELSREKKESFSEKKESSNEKKEEKHVKKQKKRIFSAKSSSDGSENSESASSDSDEERKAQKSFDKELQKILEEEALGGTSMYDRVKRRSSAARGDIKNDIIEKQKEYLEALKKQRDRQKAKEKKRRRIRMSSSSDENQGEEDEEKEEEESEKEGEKEEEQEEEEEVPPPKKAKKFHKERNHEEDEKQKEDKGKKEPPKKKGKGEKPQLKIDDVFGHGESSDEELEKKEEPKLEEAKKEKKKRQRGKSEEKTDSEENEEPPSKKMKSDKPKVQEDQAKEDRVEQKKKRGRKPKSEKEKESKREKTPEKKAEKKKSVDTSGGEDSAEPEKIEKEPLRGSKKERKEARRKEREKLKEERRKKKIEKLEKSLEKAKAKAQERETHSREESDSAGSGPAGKKKPDGGSSPLMTKAALKAGPSPSKGGAQQPEQEQEKTTLDTNEKVPSDIVEALKRSSEEGVPEADEAEPVVLQEYAEEVQLEGVEPGDQVLVLGENGQVEQFEVQAEGQQEQQRPTSDLGESAKTELNESKASEMEVDKSETESAEPSEPISSGLENEPSEPAGEKLSLSGVDKESSEPAGGELNSSGMENEQSEPAGGKLNSSGIENESGEPSDSQLDSSGLEKDSIEPAGGKLNSSGTETEVAPVKEVKEETWLPTSEIPAQVVTTEYSEGAEYSMESEDMKAHALLAEQRSDPSSHVDEVIDDVVHGYVEIDPEKLIKMTAKQAAAQKKSPTENQPPEDVWNSVQAQQQQQQQSQQKGAGQFQQQGAAGVSTSGSSSGTVFSDAETVSSAAVQSVVDASHAQAMMHQQRVSSAASVSQAQTLSQAPIPSASAAYEQLLLQANLQQIAAAAHSSGMSPRLPMSSAAYATPHSGYPTPSALYSGGVSSPYQMPGLDTQARMLLGLQAQKQAWGGLLPGGTGANQLPHAAMEHLQRLQLEQQRQQQLMAATFQQQQQQHQQSQQKQVTQAQQVPAQTQPHTQAQQSYPAVSQQQQTPQTAQQQPKTEPHTAAQQESVPVSLSEQSQGQENATPPGGGERILQKFPVKWQGYLALKTDQALVQMHFVSGNPQLIGSSLPPSGGDQMTSTLRISQRMRLEQQQLDGVQRRMHMPTEHCVLLALPCGHSAEDIIHYSKVLHEGFINYLSAKQAAGIVNVNVENQCTFVVHIFPPCEFAQSHLLTAAPDFLRSIQERNTSFLFVVITTVN